MLLQADWLIPVGTPPIAGGALLVAGGAIAGLGPAEEFRAEHPGRETWSFPGCALLPGLINAHSHLEYSAFLGFAPPCGFGEWMLHLLRARRKLEPEDYGVSARWGAYQCVRSGVTTIADTSFEGWTTVRACRAAGLRARAYLEVFGMDDAELPAVLVRLEQRLADLESELGPGIEIGVSPHAPYTVSARLYRELARYAGARGLRLATHLAESAAEVELLERGTGAIAAAYRAARLPRGRGGKAPGVSPVAYVAETGALGPRTLAVHCVHVGGADIVTLARSSTPVAHCPRSNTRLGCGRAPVAELQDAGVTVGLGTDSLASNESLDMFEEMRAALAVDQARAVIAIDQAQAALAVDQAQAAPVPGPSREKTAPGGAAASPAGRIDEGTVLRMATLDGARALGWDGLIGSLEPGKRADIIAVRVPVTAPAGRTEIRGPELLRRLVRQTGAADVMMTMVDGRVIFNRDQRCGDALLNEADLSDTEREFASVRAKLGLTGNREGG